LTTISAASSARGKVGTAQSKIRIADLDIGCNPDHVTLPRRLLKALQASFAAGGDPKDTVDRIPPANPLFPTAGTAPGRSRYSPAI